MEKKTVWLQLRITPTLRAAMEKAVEQGKAESISHLVRQALRQFLEQPT